jgi:hypothetical protein
LLKDRSFIADAPRRAGQSIAILLQAWQFWEAPVTLQPRKSMEPFDFGRKIDPATFEAQLAGTYHLDVGSALRKGWEMFVSHIGEFIGFTLLVILVSALTSGRAIGGSLVVSLVAAPLYAGYQIAAFRIMSGKEFRFSDFFKGFGYFLPLLLAGLAIGFIVAAGIMLLVIPGIYLSVAYLFAFNLVVDHGMEFWQAMETSRKVVTKHWFGFFGFMLVISLVNLLGIAALGVGVLVTIPVTACATAVAYRQIFGEHDGEW